MSFLNDLRAAFRRPAPVTISCDRCGPGWWKADHIKGLDAAPVFAHRDEAHDHLVIIFRWAITPVEWVCASCLHADTTLSADEQAEFVSLVMRFQGGEQ